MNWTEKSLKAEYKTAHNKGWIISFADAGQQYDFASHLLMAIASRETNMRNILGDNGHGHGLMQIDDRSYPEWCSSNAWKDVAQSIMKGAQVLDSKRTIVESGQGKKIAFKGTSFLGKNGLSAEEILEISVSSYNCGLWAYYNFSKGKDVDATSTGKNYSADVLARSAVFAQLIG